MKETYVTPEVMIINVMTEQAVFSSSPAGDNNAPILGPGEDF